MARLINIDNGGTLTDVWVMDGDRSFHTKTLTTPYDLSSCFFEGLKKASTLLYGQEDLPTLLQTTDHIRYSTTQG
ncbi:MAG: hydantoinase/oxoprolinase N-terminal domain-containing protein, partial [Pseudomonadota bacterium]